MYQSYFQSKEWAQVKQSDRWHVESVGSSDSQISCFVYKSPIGQVVYVPGLDSITKNVLDALRQHFASAVVIKVEPVAPANEAWTKLFKTEGWKLAKNIQYTHTVMLDLTKSEEELLTEVKKRGRYEIRQAQKAGVTVAQVPANDDNLNKMYDLLIGTSTRKQFLIRDKNFTFDFWRSFAAADKLRLYFATHKSKLVAGAVVVLSDNKKLAWYKEGASIPDQVNLFGSRLLVWQMALLLKNEDVATLDLGGISDPAKYESSPLKGIYIFKTAFSPDTVQMMPAYELRLKPLRQKMWQAVEKTYFSFVKPITKKFRFRQTPHN